MLWVTHLFRDYVRRQTRRLALCNDLTPSQLGRIDGESKCFTSEGTINEEICSAGRGQNPPEKRDRCGMRVPLPIRNVLRCTRIPVPIPHTDTPTKERTTPRWRISATERRVRTIGDCQTQEALTLEIAASRPESLSCDCEGAHPLYYIVLTSHHQLQIHLLWTTQLNLAAQYLMWSPQKSE